MTFIRAAHNAVRSLSTEIPRSLAVIGSVMGKDLRSVVTLAFHASTYRHCPGFVSAGAVWSCVAYALGAFADAHQAQRLRIG